MDKKEQNTCVFNQWFEIWISNELPLPTIEEEGHKFVPFQPLSFDQSRAERIDHTLSTYFILLHILPLATLWLEASGCQEVQFKFVDNFAGMWLSSHLDVLYC